MCNDSLTPSVKSLEWPGDETSVTINEGKLYMHSQIYVIMVDA